MFSFSNSCYIQLWCHSVLLFTFDIGGFWTCKQICFFYFLHEYFWREKKILVGLEREPSFCCFWWVLRSRNGLVKKKQLWRLELLSMEQESGGRYLRILNSAVYSIFVQMLISRLVVLRSLLRRPEHILCKLLVFLLIRRTRNYFAQEIYIEI